MTDADAAGLPPLPEYADNPFVARLPPIRRLQEIQRSFDCPPLLMDHDRLRAPEERLHAVLRLLHYSQPTLTARKLGLRIDQMIRQSYIGRDPSTSQWLRFATACAVLEKGEKDKKRRGRHSPADGDVLSQLTPIRDTSMSSLVVGPPGMGKTHSCRTALAHYPQVIFHDEPVQVPQIVWLRIECPPDGSLVALCRFFFSAADKALHEAGHESSLHAQYRSATLAVMLTGMARVANLHAIGLLVVDEIQHVKISRGEGSALLNFLVTLRNTIGISLLMIGTMSALPVMQRTFRDARRADGIGSVNFSRMAPADDTEAGDAASAQPGEGGAMAIVRPVYGEEFRQFVTAMWRWQYTNVASELTVNILNAFYEETQGVIDLVVKLFILSQMQLMTITSAYPDFQEVITADLVREVADTSFNTVRPFIKALRENDMKALQLYEDLGDFSDWFVNQVNGHGIAENLPVNDLDHGAMRLPPMVVEGAIDRTVVGQLLEGFGIAVKDREILMSRHRKIIEDGNVAGLVNAVKSDVDALAARGRLPAEPKRKRAAPIKDDIRGKLDGVDDAAAVAEALGAVDLEDALAD